MKLDECIKRISRYLRNDDTQPRLVNVQNISDLNVIKQHFQVGDNLFLSAENFSNPDENIRMELLLNTLGNNNGVIFLTGVTTHLMLLGEYELKKNFSQLLNKTDISCHLVVLCYQCEKYLVTKDIDVRLERRIYSVDGTKDEKPCIVFFPPEMSVQFDGTVVDGIDKISTAIEIVSSETIYVKTHKHRNSYPLSLYHISEQNSAYEVLCKLDSGTRQLKEIWGSQEQWTYALDGLAKNQSSWAPFITNLFGNISNLELVAGNWHFFDENKKWLYFIALKLYGAKNSWCLTTAITDSNSLNELIRCIYRSILSADWNDNEFWHKYNERKELIRSFGYLETEVLDYCSMVKSKAQHALYYLTDTSSMERTLIFENLNAYGLDYTREIITDILSHVYPDLYAYLLPFHFKQDLLNSYFQDYKFEKVINKIFPEFQQLVDEQATRRDFNFLLPSRSEKIESIDKTDTHLYFIDAMGVEYLGFIMEKCRQKRLIAYTTICHCELPSITSFNKEFIEVFESAGATLVPDKNGIKALDKIKHHGQDDFDYRNNTLPLHLAKELEIIDSVLETIHTKLVTGKCTKAVMISDHGASRLSVISNKENQWEMSTKSEHSGRCCPKSDISNCPTCATEENDFWVLANYDRFKGSRKANVEVHGGATLEEVTVPIIEITYTTAEIEVTMLTPSIEFSTMKKNALIKLFSKTKLNDVIVKVAGKDFIYEYEAHSSDGQIFKVKIPELRKIGDYFVDVYFNNNKIAAALKFTAKKEGFTEKNLL